MLEDFLEEIYKKAFTIEYARETLFYATMWHTERLSQTWNAMLGYKNAISKELSESDPDMLYDLETCILAIKRLLKDKSLFSASIETGLIPRLFRYMDKYTGIDVTEGEWTLESAQTGFLTVRNGKGIYLHSPSDPMWEAYLLAYNMYDPDVRRYDILCPGLGYLPYQLWRLSEGSADIYVYETDSNMREFADKYGVMSLIPEDVLHIVDNDDLDVMIGDFLDPDSKGENISFIYYWDTSKYDGTYASFLEEKESNDLVRRDFIHKWRVNLNKNMDLNHHPLDELIKSAEEAEWIVVAAGPSLDDNSEFIKDSVGKRKICAINASLKWFVRNGIKPDLCTACDPFDTLLPHIEGIEDFSEDIPLVADVVANWKFLDAYKGPKYYAFSPSSVQLRKKQYEDIPVWSFGGTVTCMAMEAVVKMGAKKVYLVGADFAYPGGRTYANDVGHDAGYRDGSDINRKKEEKRIKLDEYDLISVKDEYVQSIAAFKMFKECAEAIIRSSPEVQFYNMSTGGAYIKGAFTGFWWEKNKALKTSTDYEKYLSNMVNPSLILDWKTKYFILWQTLRKIIAENIEITDNLRNSLNMAYASIYSDFRKELDWEPTPGVSCDPGQTYIFTPAYYGGKDPTSRRLLKCAKEQVKKGRSVLLVNTVEYLGGDYTALEEFEIIPYDDSLKNAEVAFYDNKPYPYYQFGAQMPDVDYYREFLTFVDSHRPGHIIKLNEYSLLADVCSEFVPTEKYDN